MSNSNVNLEEKLGLKEIFTRILKIEDEMKISRFIDDISKYFNNAEDLKRLKESASEKDFDLVVKTLMKKTNPLTTRIFAGGALALLGDKKHEDTLRNQLINGEDPNISQQIFWMLLSPNGLLPIASRLKLIFEYVNKSLIRDRTYLKVFEERIRKEGLTEDLTRQIEDEAYYWESEQGRFQEDVAARLRVNSMKTEYKAEFAKYREEFIFMLEEHLNTPFLKQNINYDVAVNAAKILESIGLRKDIVERIRPFLATNNRCVYLAGEYGEPNFARELASQLETEDKFKDSFAWVSYCSIVIDALGELGLRFSGKKEYESELQAAFEPLCKMLCQNIDKDEILCLKLLRALENIRGKIKTAEYVVSKLMEAEDVSKSGYMGILALLTDKEAAFAKLESHFFKGKMEEKRKAEIAIEHMGLSQAVDLLVTEELSGYYSKYIGEPMKNVETESLNILKRTVKQVERTYTVNTMMSVTVFVVGIIVIFMGAILVLTGTSDVSQLFGGASVVGGIVTTLYSFAKGPISSVQTAVADLAQVETAFLYHVRSTGLASFAFLREFLKEKNPDITILEKCADTMNEVAKDTMLLIELYGGGKDTINNLLDAKKDELTEIIMATQKTETQKTETPTANNQKITTNPK